HDGVAVDQGCGAAAGVERALLAERDHPVAPALELLRLRVGGLHRLVLKERGHEVPEERPPMGRRPVELHSCDAMAHGSARLALALEPAAIELLARGEPFEAQPEAETH